MCGRDDTLGSGKAGGYTGLPSSERMHEVGEPTDEVLRSTIGIRALVESNSSVSC